ncbi:Hypothetical predicted protein [Lecanosticta acicola]|uniref:Integral membrane protein n=1 Tax=Lecanosticta acicola TaxID=111012 RepID=A0AAI8YXE2_9PEZI|nr:Hypothetical predicted protein [Lecanosticta acicola]
MGAGACIEPLVVAALFFGGAWINRERNSSSSALTRAKHKRDDNIEFDPSSPPIEDGLLTPRAPPPGHLHQDCGWRSRRIGLFGWQKDVPSPDTSQFSYRPLSRVLYNFPFLVEVWYCLLTDWIYQLGRALLVEGTVHTARKHALQLIQVEKALRIFREPAIQRYLLQYPTTMHWINCIYSLIHIPGTILFLIGLFYMTVTANRAPEAVAERSPAGPALYQARRRTIAMCNLIAFVVFTAWPCMPPRLLSDPSYQGPSANRAKSFRFVDTVHTADGEGSIWTQNKIVATANHFILDAVAGALVCAIAWIAEPFLLNLLPLEDWFLWCLRMHKPAVEVDARGSWDEK